MSTPKVLQETVVETTRKYRVEVGRVELIKALRIVGVKVPDAASVYVNVPGDGDWSNTSLDVDSECPIVVSWNECSREETERTL